MRLFFCISCVFEECIRRHKNSLYAVFYCGAEQDAVLALFTYCDIALLRAAADAVFEIRIFGAEGIFKVGQAVFSDAVSLFVFAKPRFFQTVYYVHLTIDRCNRIFISLSLPKSILLLEM